MISTAVPVSHNGLTVYGAGSPVYGIGLPTGSNPPSCFLGIGGSGCGVDLSGWKSWVGAQGSADVIGNLGESIRQSSIGIKDFTVSGDKIAKLLPFIVLMLAFGLAIGWSKGRRYFI